MLDISIKEPQEQTSLILLASWHKKMTQKWDVEDLLELWIDAMNCVVNKERLMEALKKNQKDVKRTNLEYYNANINSECWVTMLWLTYTRRGGEG